MADSLFEHYKRWNLEYDSDQQFKQFRYRVDRLTSETNLQNEVYEDLCFFLGSAPTPHNSKNLGSILTQGTTQKYFAHLLQLVFLSYESNRYLADVDFLFRIVQTALLYSPAVTFEVAKAGENVIVYPKGAQLLDTEVVNQSLTWLSGYPDALRPFQTALTQYMGGDATQQRNLLDNLRLSLEQLLKQLLGNQKSFENQQADLNTWLGGKEVHQQVISLYNQVLFSPYRIYQNEAVKHNEAFKEHDIEFMIYLSATLMRLLLQLEQN